MAKDVWVLHGPNLGLLGRREPELYGRETLESIDKRLVALGSELGLRVAAFQTNHEGALIDRITMAMDEVDGCVINPAALSHTSLALADTLRAVSIPIVEVHMTNLYARDPERQMSITGSAALRGGDGVWAQELRAGASGARRASPSFSRGTGAQTEMNLRRTIQELVQIMREEDLAEIEVRRLFSAIRVRRPGADPASMASAYVPAAPAADSENHEGDAAAANLIPIKSPMVGTFYRSPAPDADPYVEENSTDRRRTDGLHRGSDEANERDRIGRKRKNHQHPRRERPARGVRAGSLSRSKPKAPRRQGRGERNEHQARLAEDGGAQGVGPSREGRHQAFRACERRARGDRRAGAHRRPIWRRSSIRS